MVQLAAPQRLSGLPPTVAATQPLVGGGSNGLAAKSSVEGGRQAPGLPLEGTVPREAVAQAGLPALAHDMPPLPVPGDSFAVRAGDLAQRGIDAARRLTGGQGSAMLDAAEHIVNGQWGKVGSSLVQGGRAFAKESLREMKVAATGVAAANAVGAGAFAGYHGVVQEQRVTTSVTPQNARAELAKLDRDPDGYLKANYTNTVAGVDVGPQGFNFDAHVKQAPRLDGKPGGRYRRVPADLEAALEQVQGHPGPVMDTTRGQQGVEVRPPFRKEPLRDAQHSLSVEPGSTPLSFKVKADLAIGPADGWQAHAGGEAALNKPVTADSTAVKWAIPSATGQTWGVSARQQETTVANKFALNLNAIDVNHSQACDLTRPGSFLSGREVQVLNGNLYAQSGSRDRVQVDATASGSFARIRRTGFAEAGVSADYLKVKQGGRYVGIGGYSEAQLYPKVFTGEVKLQDAAGKFAPGPRLSGPTTTALPVELDTSPLQVSTNAHPNVEAAIMDPAAFGSVLWMGLAQSPVGDPASRDAP